MDETNVIMFGSGLLAVLTGFVVEALKKSNLVPWVNENTAPLASIITGVVLGLLSSLTVPNVPIYMGLYGGLVAAASASGFYTWVRKARE